jgi:hypothetical protein
MDLENVEKLLDEILEDRTVPRNIKSAVESAKNDLKNTEHDLAYRISSAISTLDEISNDANIPVYTRTQIWNIVSMLEVIGQSK